MKTFICIVYLMLEIKKITGEPGIVHVETQENKQNEDFCMNYNPDFQKISTNLEDASQLHLVDLTPSVLCSEPSPPLPISGAAWAVNRGNCTFTEKAFQVQSHEGKALLVVSNNGLFTPSANTTSDYNEINITVALITAKDFAEIKTLGSNISVQLYAPPLPKSDYNLAVIWLLAVGTVAIGSYLSGTVKHRLYMKRRRKKTGERGPVSSRSDISDDESEPTTLDISWPFVIVFVVIMCGMLVSLYFFYDYLVYAIIGLFALACSTALYSTLKPIMLRIPCLGSCRLPGVKIRYLPFLRRRVEVRRIILAILCLGVGATWIVFRHESWSWILQDVLGVLFCIQMLKTLRMPNLKIICILLVLLFLYDIFFVFITPLFTKKGESIMVKVATGEKSKTGEMLPMVLKVPRFSRSVLSVCNMPFSLLGFGDIMVPGLLVSYCYGFDLKVGSKKIYYIASVTAYGVGLLITFGALALMKVGQPALLYLVPCTVLTTLVIALCRKEVKHLWHGEDRGKKKAKNNERSEECDQDIVTNPTDSEEENVNDPGEGQIPKEPANRIDHNDEDRASDTSNEQQSLLVN